MGYFDKANEEAERKLNATIKAQRLAYIKRSKENIEVNEIIKNRAKFRKEYLEQRIFGKTEDLVFSHKLNAYILYQDLTPELIEYEEDLANNQ